MSGLEPGAVYRALQEVQDGADPADVYAELMGDAIDPEEAIQEAIADADDEAHDFPECREKYQRLGICFGTTCHHAPNMIITTDCPCKCHEGEWD